MAFAQVDLQKEIDFAVSSLSLQEAIYALSEVAGYNISFTNNILPKDHSISLQFEASPLEMVLEALLKDLDIGYELVGTQIVLVRRMRPRRKFIISGYIKDARTGEKLIAANIYDPKTGKGTTSNNYGFYSIVQLEGPVELIFSYLGYQAVRKKIDLSTSLRLDIDLSASLTLTEVLVVAEDSIYVELGDISTEQIIPQQYETLPALGGEVDVIRLSHLLPGVQTGADGVGGIHIRGGSADQNLVLLDGVPVYNPTHMIGVFSVFNSSTVSSAQLIKGSFPAHYGGRLSSILDVRTKEGNKKQYGGELTLGMTSARLSVEGPIKRDTSSFIFSARKSFVNGFIRPVSRLIKEDRGQSGESTYSFYDLNAKLSWALSSRDELFLSFYRGEDDYSNDTKTIFSDVPSGYSYQEQVEQDLRWGNTLANLRWNRIFGSRLFADMNLSYSRYDFESKDLYEYQDTIVNLLGFREFRIAQFTSKIEDISARIDVDFIPSPNHYLRFGMGLIRHSFRPGVAGLSGNAALTVAEITSIVQFLSSLDNATIETLEADIYVEDDIKIGRKWRIKPGLRLSGLQVQEELYNQLEPRLALAFSPNRKWSLKSSFSLMSQYLHLLTTSGIGLPNDLWVPSTARIRPQRSWQAVFGIDYRMADLFDLNLEAYYKKMDQVITFQEGGSISFINADNWENNVTVGQGWSYGTELALTKSKGKTTGSINYTLSWSNRQFDEINLGRKFPFRYDRRHNVKILLVHRLNKGWQLTGNWVYGTGIATTLPISEYIFTLPSFFPEQPALNFGEKNSLRLPANHRLDVGVHRQFVRGIWQHKLSFGVYNLYNRQNPLYYRLSRDNQNPLTPGESLYKQATLLPILPYISYNIRI
ncbi:MAG: TonB-dependent receptor [Bacteroidota bacterium]